MHSRGASPSPALLWGCAGLCSLGRLDGKHRRLCSYIPNSCWPSSALGSPGLPLVFMWISPVPAPLQLESGLFLFCPWSRCWCKPLTQKLQRRVEVLPLAQGNVWAVFNEALLRGSARGLQQLGLPGCSCPLPKAPGRRDSVDKYPKAVLCP